MVAAPKEDDAGICPEYGFETLVNRAEPRERYCEGSWLMFASGMPSRVFFEPRYESSTFQFVAMVFSTVKFHCCEYPEPLLRSTPKTPCPRPEFGFGAVT